jgi:hypothetical protein
MDGKTNRWTGIWSDRLTDTDIWGQVDRKTDTQTDRYREGGTDCTVN